VSRLAVLLATFLLALPAAAFAQGAGDDQYQDPFGDEPTQSGSGGGASNDGGGLSDSPPVGGSSGSSGSGTPPSSDGATAGAAGPAEPSGTTAVATEQTPGELPNTGADPRVLLLLGSALLLSGIGLRLRTIDPDAF
jgi:LPXTG-motif cell wall-anchored protein